MTAEKKLAKAIEFIKSIQKLDKRKYDTFDLNELEKFACAYCDDCDSVVDVKMNWPARIFLNTEYIDYRVIDDLSDKAWHVLADIED